MTAEEFQLWTKAMKAAGIVTRETSCQELLKISNASYHNYKKRGAPYHIALACSALLHKKKAYGQ